MQAKRVGAGIIVIFCLFILIPSTPVRASHFVYSSGQTIGVQNAVFGSRFNLNIHFDPNRRNVWSSSRGMLMDEGINLVIATKWYGDGSVMAFAPSREYPEYWYYVADVNPNSFEQNGAHVRNGARGGVGSDIIFSVNSKIISHFIPTSSLEDPNLKASIAPFFYIEITIENYTDQPQSGELLVAMNGAFDCKKNNNTCIMYFKNGADGEGARAIAVLNEQPGWEISSRVFEHFHEGRLQNYIQKSNESYPGGFSLSFNLGPRAQTKKLFVYAAYNNSTVMVDKRNNANLKFYYTEFFDSIEEVIDYAFNEYSEIRKKSDNFNGLIKTGNTTDLMIGQAIHSYLGNSWLLYDSVNGRPRYYVSEGSCQFLSTVDVAYETALFEVEYIPWALKLQLEEWLDYMLRDAYGPYLQHDMGVGTEVRKSQAYSGEMKVEEIVDYILILFLYWKKTGDTAFVSSKMPLLRDFLVSLQKRDTDGNGIVDKEAGYTTFDFDWGNSALGIGQENVYLAIKELTTFLVVEQFEKAISGNGKVYREYAGKISETLKRIYQQYGRLPVSAKDIYKRGWADYTIVNFEGLLYFIITGTEDPLIDELLCVVAPSHLFALQNCGLRLTSSHPAIWLSKALNAKIVNDYFITRGYYTYEDSIIPEIETKVREMELGWTDYNLGSPILYLYPRGVGPATAIVNLMDDFVELNYKIWLHRPSDAGGRSFHFGFLRSGSLTPNQMTQNFRHSYEYVYETPFKINSIECRGFVDYAFVFWFGYHQDKEGHDLFCNLITSWQRCDVWVFWEFYRAWVVIKAYRELLYREPDVSGFSCYLENMRDRGWTEAQVRQSIMDSPEYRLKHPY